MAARHDDEEIARIIQIAERAFGRPSEFPPLELARSQRIGTARRGSVTAALSLALAVLAVPSLLLVTEQYPRRARPPVRHTVTVVQQVPLPPPPEPVPPPPEPVAVAVETAPPKPAPPVAGQQRRHEPVRSVAEPLRQLAATAPPRPPEHPDTIAVRLSGEALQRALAEDRIVTRELNEAELHRVRHPS